MTDLIKKQKQEWSKLARDAKIPKELQEKVKARFDRQSPINIKIKKG